MPNASDRRSVLRGMLTAGAAIAAPATAIASGLPAPAALVSLAAAPASARDRLLEMEGQEFMLLTDRFIGLFEEQCDATDQEKATRVRFKAEAPLRSKRPWGKNPSVYYDIVRDEPSREAGIEALKARVGKPKKPGNLLGMRFKMSVLKAYHTLADHPFYTEEGKIQRRMIGAFERWEYALHASARETGYESARRRRMVANRDVSEAVAELLKHKPKSVEGLKLQAGACLADPYGATRETG